MIIVGLGNPGIEYEHTRHNVGFMFLDYLATEMSLTFLNEKKFKSLIATNSSGTVLMKPLTFMNDSGVSIRSYLDFHKMEINNNTFIVIHDDLDIKVGSYKVSTHSPKGHNGLLSIDNQTHVINYLKVKIGVENRTEHIPGPTYVLQRFSPEELDILKPLFKEIKTFLKL